MKTGCVLKLWNGRQRGRKIFLKGAKPLYLFTGCTLLKISRNEERVGAAPDQRRYAISVQEPGCAHTTEVIVYSFDQRRKAIPFENEMPFDLRNRQQLDVVIDELLKLFGHYIL